MGLIQPTYTIIQAANSGNFLTQWNSCLEQLTSTIKNKEWSPVRISIFIKSKNLSEYSTQYKKIQHSLKATFGDECPPFALIMQEPEDPFLLMFEVGFVKNDSVSVSYGSFQNSSYCIAKSGTYKEYWMMGTQSLDEKKSTMELSEAAFCQLKELYDHLRLSFNQIVRQWNYVGQILTNQSEGNRIRQNYQILNEIRSDYYKHYRSRKNFPAATGIGMRHPGIIIESIALSGNDKLKIIPISNPVQTESYHYEQEVLVGNPDKKRAQNQPPQFERAVLITNEDSSRLIISGTASIINQETIGIDDIEQQTRTTLQNIQRLASPDNLKKHVPNLKAIPDHYSYVRVYIKNKKDLLKVKAICTEILDDVPCTFIVADVCRENLLVEIETELATR
jgi:enamine deaminase RidA (YjgF/YER057c/UK114 family)